MSLDRLKYHESWCDCGYLNPVTEWAGGIYVKIVAYECPKCKKRTSASELVGIKGECYQNFSVRGE